ncbi:MAG TPA: hypothetical protein VEK07_21140 [Polyangiaceae bacterium]|nr:hypothetical protein [Polyangiaceae bacterium]
MDPVGPARVAAALGVAGVLVAANAWTAESADVSPIRIDLWADRDDDDADGRPDSEEDVLPPAARLDLVTIDARIAGATLELLSGGEHARVVDPTGAGRAWGPEVLAAGWFQGISPGRVELSASSHGVVRRITLVVSGIGMRDGSGSPVDMARSHASLERTAPERVPVGPDAKYDDFDALRVVMTRPEESTDVDTDRELSVESVDSSGNHLDELKSITLAPAACDPSYAEARCWASAPLRFVTDDVDRNHPLVIGRSLKAQVGGAVVFRLQGRKAQMIRVLGPRDSPAGPIGRLRATLRPFVVRVTPGGAPSIGGTEAGAVESLRGELAAASAVWGQCGVIFGDGRQFDVKIVDPPPAHLVSIGDDLGLPASGGEVRLRVDGKTLTVPTRAGESPDAVAEDVARAAERLGLSPIVSPNARIGPGLGPSVDVSLRRKDGTLVAADSVPGTALSTDATLAVRIGSVDLSDGLQHFTDMDAMAGTLEERTLLKAIDDGNPATIEVVVVPLFAGGGRIGESFIGSDLSSVRNVVLLDRAGIRARKSSLTLAHELGHVLMDLPGHPDDYGVDTPTLLMDSDAADASPFGPRRIPLEHCARVVRQSGPGARSPLLVDWPVGPVPIAPWRRSP